MEKKLITEREIEEAAKVGKTKLDIPANAIVTPLAKDMAKKLGLALDSDYPSTIIDDSFKYSSGEQISAKLALKFYHLMLKIRLFEELVKRYKESGLIPGVMVHSYMGQEAIAVGVCSNLLKEDYLTSTHRGHGHLIAKGADLGKMLAEILGKQDGYCKGKGGSMHITDIGIGILGANGIVGAGLPIACGSALVSRLQSDNFITVSFFGDGASNQGTFGESLNFAKIFSLPVLFICENNGYAVSTPVSYSCRGQLIYKRAIGYEIIAESINGDDVFEVYSVCKKHIDSMRKNPHPVLIEASTHRQIGHWVGDPQKYRDPAELKNLSIYDPIRIFLQKIRTRTDISEEDLGEVGVKVVEELKAATKFADNSPYPALEEAVEDFIKE